MANPLDKVLEMMNLNPSDEEMDYEYEEEEATHVKHASEKPKKSSGRVPGRSRRNGEEASSEICVIKPASIEDGREITDTLRDNRSVLLNLEGIDIDVAQRIIDFTSGSCYAMRGNMQKISHYIFVITPPTVDISGDFSDFIGNAPSKESIETPSIQRNEL